MQNELTILYGGKSGNSEFIAREAGNYFLTQGLKTSVVNMAKYKIERLQEEKLLLIVVSTHGEGDPPPAAAAFYRKLMNRSFDLAHLEYAVCALGDSSYEFFCQTGKNIDKRLGELGAIRIYQRVDCDVNFEKTAASWIGAVLKSRLPGEKAEIKMEEADHIRYHEAVIKEKYLLNEGSPDPVFHLVLKTDPAQVRYLPGDNIGILPPNPDELVNELLRFLNFSPDYRCIYEGEEMTLRDLFGFKLEITTLCKDLIMRYQERTGNDLLGELLKDEQALYAYYRRRDLADLLHDFPSVLSPEELISILRPLRPRYYSIASSQSAAPDEIHLTVKLVKFSFLERTREGACSAYLSRYLEPGSPIRFQLRTGDHFRLPEKAETPLILIASGTGIAPFRAFMQERALTGNTRIWMIFGEKHEASDLLYKNELLGWKQQGLLERLDLAFSRDQERKIYVQHKITEYGKEFLSWLDAGAAVYVCGSVAMGKEVRRAILGLFEASLQLSSSKSASMIDQLSAKGRYCEDLY